MDTPFTPTSELRQVCVEYKQYFPEINLVDPDNGSGVSENPYLHIRTNDDVTVRVSVSVAGWYQASDPTKLYPTFESLMMDAVPGFQSQFAEELYSRIANMG
ncbi:hypothetical protein DICA3_F20164 [Diutina catenulata]